MVKPLSCMLEALHLILGAALNGQVLSLALPVWALVPQIWPQPTVPVCEGPLAFTEDTTGKAITKGRKRRSVLAGE